MRISKTSVLLIAMAMAAAAPAVAAEKKAKKATAKPAAAAAQKIDSNEASWRLVKGAMPIVLPWWSMPVYMKVAGEDATKLDDSMKPKPAPKKKAAAR